MFVKEVTDLGSLSAAIGVPSVLFNIDDNWHEVDIVTAESGHAARDKGREDV